jgi:AraC family transcriptional regulator
MNQLAPSAARLASAFPSPPEASAAWSSFSLHLLDVPEHIDVTLTEHVVTVLASGSFRARQVVDRQSFEGWCAPGCVGFTPANRRVTWERRRTSGATCSPTLLIPEAFVARIVAQDWEKDSLKIEQFSQCFARDPIVDAIVTRLAFEARHGSPAGSLYAESACEFLAHHLVRTYSSLSTRPLRFRGGLPPSRLKVVLDYIHDSLAGPITLRRLAELARVSPRHFERAFRQAVGAPPHAYVMEARLAAARQLLLGEPSLTVHEIAARAGFSSSSHLAYAFRRKTGHSPAAFRRLHRA